MYFNIFIIFNLVSYADLLNEDFDLSGYDKEVIVNKNRQYATNFKFYSQELNGHYSTTSISTIIQQSQSWLGNNFDALDAAGLVGNDRTITTGELMASDNPAAADLQADLISTINSNINWSA